MRAILAVFLVGVFGFAASAAEPTKSDPVKSSPKTVIRLPKLVEPVAEPKPPTAVTKLDANTLYVVEADVECIIKQFTPGLVNITQDEGPIRIRDRFVDNPTKAETRTYTSKYVYSITAAGTGTAHIVIVPKGVDKSDDVVMLALEVNSGTGPQPPPGPPQPKPGVSPFSANGLRVLIIYPNQPETKLPAGQQLILSGQKTRDLLESSCVVGADGKTKEYRIWREDERVEFAPKLWQDAFGRKRDSVPWVLIGNGTDGFEGPLPANEDDFQKLIQKYVK